MAMKKEKQEIGIIGFGNFGQFMVKYLKPFFNTIIVYDKKNIKKAAIKAGVSSASLQQVASKDIVIIAVPVKFFKNVIISIKKYLKPDATIIDVSSVKVKPVKIMLKYLPKSVDIIATHPLFGPQSGKKGIKDLKIVVCPLRIKKDRLANIKYFLKNKLEFNVIVSTPDQHDKEMAYVQGLTHFIGRALKEMKIRDSKQGTVAYQHLIKIKKLLEKDSMDLFLTIEKENSFAKDVRKEFIRRLNDLQSLIDKN